MLALGWRDAKFGPVTDWDKAYHYAQQVESSISFYLDDPEMSYPLNDIEHVYYNALAWWKERADAGDARAAYSLGLALLESDVAAANVRFGQAADLGYAPAMRKIGKDYWNGENGRPFDEQKAIKWLKKAAREGNVQSMGDLAWYYSTKNIDWDEAIKFSTQILEQEYKNENREVVLIQLHRLGSEYMTGEHVEKNIPLAVQYYERASKLGDSDADYLIATLILKGYDIEGGAERALGLLRRASDVQIGPVLRKRCSR
jgi:TPR repeat protein